MQEFEMRTNTGNTGSEQRKMRKEYAQSLIMLAMMGLGVLPGMSVYAAPPAISAGDAAVLADGGNQANAVMRKNQWQDRQWMNRQTEAGNKMTAEVPEKEKEVIPEGERVQVNSFRVTGQDVFPEETLTALLASRQGKKLSFADLQKGADTLTAYFRNHGYIVAKTIIPPQDITDGTVTY